MKHTTSLSLAFLGLSAFLPLAASAQNFGGTVTSYSHLSTNASYSDPSAVLGQPTTLVNDAFPNLYHSSMVEPAYGKDHTTGKNLITGFDSSGTGQLTVQMSAPITHSATSWFGQDFILFSNQGFVGKSGYASDGTDMSAYQIAASGTTFGTLPQVSVSADGVTFYSVTRSSTVLFPENPFHWDGLAATSTADAGWGALNDFAKPVDPTLTAASFANQTVAFADNTLYNGSAGGTSYSFFGQTPLTTIDYVRFSANPTGSGGIIDGIAAVGSAPVPEASTLTAFLIGLLGLAAAAYRRRKPSVIAAISVIGLSVILPGGAHALSFTPQITQTVGTGSSESFLTLDFQDGTADHNYAFGYFYDGAKTGADMLAALAAGTSLNVGYDPKFSPGNPAGVLVTSFSLNSHSQVGGNVNYWGYWLGQDGQTWQFSGVGASGRDLTNGSWDGWSWDVNNADIAPLTPAAVPESDTLCLFSLGLAGLTVTLIRKRIVSA